MDLLLDTDGDLDITNAAFSLSSGGQAVAQDMRCRLLFFLGEWYLDTGLGVDWFGTALKKNPKMSQVQSMIRQTAQGTPGVKAITHLTFSLDAETRTLSVDIRGELEDDLGTFDWSFSELLLQRFSEAA